MYTCVHVIHPHRYAGGRTDTGVGGQRNREMNWLCDLNFISFPVEQLGTDCSYNCQIRPAVLSSYMNIHTLFTCSSLLCSMYILLKIYSDNINLSVWYMTCGVGLQRQEVGEVIDFTRVSGSGQNGSHFREGGVQLQASPWNVQPWLAPPSCVSKSGLLCPTHIRVTDMYVNLR